ncbi:MAG: OPT family oligopeptide transporter [Thermoplasmatota archaeon]
MAVPYIPASRSLPELTVKGVILGIVLSMVLGAANAYLGLRVGLTVSASIPAAVMSMAILRAFRNHNILENNAVQTGASAGESLAAGVIFTIPALIILDAWTEVRYLETTIIALIGGMLGVLFTVPLRKALIVEAELRFPEGVATSEVLKTGEGDNPEKTGVIALAIGASVGLVYKFLQSGTKMWTDTALFARRFRDNGVFGFGSDLSPALLGVGYIVGLQIAVLVFLGGVIGWVIGIPLLSLLADGTVIEGTDWSTLSAEDAAGFLWSKQIRYMGVGAMLVGGVWSLLQLRKPLGQALTQGLAAARREDDGAKVLRTERELSLRGTFLGVLGMVIPIFLLYWAITWELGPFYSLSVALTMALLMVITGFFFSAVGAYMAGVVGSSNNPISGVTILTVLAAAYSLRFLGVETPLGPEATILVAGVIAAAAAIASDNMQDLKAGNILGSTPKKQQIMQIVGVTALALVIAPVLDVLNRANGGFGSEELAAPQAGLMAAVATFVFEGGLPGAMIGIGAAIAVGLILLDATLKRSGARFRTPVMPVAVGIYLPVGLSVPIFLGGLIAWATGRRFDLWRKDPKTNKTSTWWEEAKAQGNRAGTLFASGLIAGEALVGILIAVLLVTIGVEVAPGVFELPFSVGLDDLTWPGLLLFGYIALLLTYLALRPGFKRS